MGSFMVIMQLFMFLIITMNIKQIYARGCKFTTPKDSAEITRNVEFFCQTKDKKLDDSCISIFIPYFREVGENETSIKEFVNLYDYLDADKFKIVIFTLKDFCYNMDRAVQLSKVLPILHWHILYWRAYFNITEFDLNFLDWEKYGRNAYGGVQIEKCVGHSSEVIEVLETLYIPWFNRQGGKGYCDCNEIVGLKGFFTRKSHNNDLTAASVYKDFCSTENEDGRKREHKWKIIQLKEVTDYESVSYEEKKKFINLATKIGEAGWLDEIEKRWTFEEIHSLIYNIKDTRNSNYEEAANLVGIGIKKKFSYEEFYNYTKILKKYDSYDFVTAQCLTDVFNHLINISTKHEKGFFERCGKDRFPKIISNFISIFHRIFPNEDCSDLVRRLLKFQEDIEKFKLQEQDVFHGTRMEKTYEYSNSYPKLIDYIKNYKY